MAALTSLGERASLRGYIGDVANPAWVDRVWVRREIDQKNDFPLDDLVHLFFDDTHYASNPEDHLGESLYEREEVAAVRRMVVALDRLLTVNKGRALTDADYVRTPEWPAVHDAAKALHAIVVANDAKMGAK